MADFLLLPAAEADLRDIWHYTAENWSPSQADRYVSGIFDCLDLIAESPAIGQPVDWIRQGYRRKIIDSHLVFYRLAEDGVPEVVRILHARMNVDDQFD